MLEGQKDLWAVDSIKFLYLPGRCFYSAACLFRVPFSKFHFFSLSPSVTNPQNLMSCLIRNLMPAANVHRFVVLFFFYYFSVFMKVNDLCTKGYLIYWWDISIVLLVVVFFTTCTLSSECGLRDPEEEKEMVHYLQSTIFKLNMKVKHSQLLSLYYYVNLLKNVSESM